MKMNAKPPLRVRLLFVVGLLLIAASLLLNYYVKIPYIVRGIMVGIGIGLEIVGIVRLRRWKIAG